MELTYGNTANISKLAKLATPTPQGMVNTLPAQNEKSIAYGRIAQLMQKGPKPTPDFNGNGVEHKKEHEAEKEFATSMVQHTLLHGMGLSHLAIFLEIGEKLTDTFSEIKEMKMKAQQADVEIALGNQANLQFANKLTMALKPDDDERENKKKKVLSYGKFGR